MQAIEKFQTAFLEHLKSKTGLEEPKTLYSPINYMLSLGGKHLRPMLTIMATDVFNTDFRKALDAALAIEVFHNFTLIHDDIMDDAPLRRGQKTVHEKWDINTGILSGDAMLIMAYQLFEGYDAETFKSLMGVFNRTALAVCEGQQYDIDFEARHNVTIPEYIKMIELKTSVLVAAALRMGAIVAHASLDNQDRIYEFGRHLGIAFQIQDDYLDAFGDKKTFGKQVGGDIIENKKTLLYLKALERTTKPQKEKLLELYSSAVSNHLKVDQVKAIFKVSGAARAVQKDIENYTLKAFSYLDTIDADPEKKEHLRAFGKWLMTRNS